MRTLNSHKVDGLNDALKIEVLDEPGQGNACHQYRVLSEGPFGISCYISFQKGPLDEYGDNGISNEALLAIVEDRLKGFQSGKFACLENALAFTNIREAMYWLHHRTRDRMSRDVEGKNKI